MKETGILSLLLMIMIEACNSSNKDLNFNQLKVNLDMQNLTLLDSLINNMERHLESTYGNRDSTDIYGSYFLNIALGDSHLEVAEIECTALRIFEKSELSEKYVTVNYDTVYVDSDQLVSVVGNDTTFEVIPGTAIVSKLIRDQKKYGFQRLTDKGRLYDALTSIKERDEMLLQYLNRKEATWNVNPKAMASYLATNHIDISNNYVLKVIVLNEIYMNELKRHGC